LYIVVKHLLAHFGLAIHPEKTWMGKAEQGFDFLGYHLHRMGLTVAKATVDHSVTRLHEHERRRSSHTFGTWCLRVLVVALGKKRVTRPAVAHVADGAPTAGQAEQAG